MPIGWPAFSSPWARSIPSAVAPALMRPTASGSSWIARSGQPQTQRPQPWHNSSSTSTAPPTTARALNSQTSAQRPQAVQRAASTRGTGRVTSRPVSHTGCRNRAALGASTSQSSNRTGRDSAATCASAVATVVLPVPPLPLATATRIVLSPPHDRHGWPRRPRSRSRRESAPGPPVRSDRRAPAPGTGASRRRARSSRPWVHRPR
jgi:hypothetical protein